jgi:hypothetical protein
MTDTDTARRKASLEQLRFAGRDIIARFGAGAAFIAVLLLMLALR